MEREGHAQITADDRMARVNASRPTLHSSLTYKRARMDEDELFDMLDAENSQDPELQQLDLRTSWTLLRINQIGRDPVLKKRRLEFDPDMTMTMDLSSFDSAQSVDPDMTMTMDLTQFDTQQNNELTNPKKRAREESNEVQTG